MGSLMCEWSAPGLVNLSGREDGDSAIAGAETFRSVLVSVGGGA